MPGLKSIHFSRRSHIATDVFGIRIPVGLKPNHQGLNRDMNRFTHSSQPTRAYCIIIFNMYQLHMCKHKSQQRPDGPTIHLNAEVIYLVLSTYWFKPIIRLYLRHSINYLVYANYTVLFKTFPWLHATKPH